ALGAAYLLRPRALREIDRRGWLDLPLEASAAGEDHLTALLTVAAGYRLGDFGGPDDPLALRWQGLPLAPEDLVARRKLVTHSVRGPHEEAIRAFFRERRASFSPPRAL